MTMRWRRGRAPCAPTANRAAIFTMPSVTTIAWTVFRARSCASNCRGWSNGTRGERSWRGFIAARLPARAWNYRSAAPPVSASIISLWSTSPIATPYARAWKNAACKRAFITRFPFICKSPINLWAIKRGDLPHAESACERVISMPLYPEMSDEQARLRGPDAAGNCGREVKERDTGDGTRDSGLSGYDRELVKARR